MSTYCFSRIAGNTPNVADATELARMSAALAGHPNRLRASHAVKSAADRELVRRTLERVAQFDRAPTPDDFRVSASLYPELLRLSRSDVVPDHAADVT